MTLSLICDVTTSCMTSCDMSGRGKSHVTGSHETGSDVIANDGSLSLKVTQVIPGH